MKLQSSLKSSLKLSVNERRRKELTRRRRKELTRRRRKELDSELDDELDFLDFLLDDELDFLDFLLDDELRDDDLLFLLVVLLVVLLPPVIFERRRRLLCFTTKVEAQQPLIFASRLATRATSVFTTEEDLMDSSIFVVDDEVSDEDSSVFDEDSSVFSVFEEVLVLVFMMICAPVFKFLMSFMLFAPSREPSFIRWSPFFKVTFPIVTVRVMRKVLISRDSMSLDNSRVDEIVVSTRFVAPSDTVVELLEPQVHEYLVPVTEFQLQANARLGLSLHFS